MLSTSISRIGLLFFDARTIFVLSMDEGTHFLLYILQQHIRARGEKGRDNGRAVQRGFFCIVSLCNCAVVRVHYFTGTMHWWASF